MGERREEAGWGMQRYDDGSHTAGEKRTGEVDM